MQQYWKYDFETKDKFLHLINIMLFIGKLGEIYSNKHKPTENVNVNSHNNGTINVSEIFLNGQQMVEHLLTTLTDFVSVFP